MTETRHVAPALLAVIVAFVLGGCDGPDPIVDAGTDAGVSVPSLPNTLGSSERPAQLVAPAAYDGTTPFPVILLLHGYSFSGGAQDTYFGLSRAARREGFYVIVPDGTPDAAGNRFWNATNACCDFGGTGVDDVSYLLGLLDELEGLAPVADIFVMGHSNGGFMSYRMSCEAADRISAFVSLAGSDYPDDTTCVPSQPVSVLQIHGDADATVSFTGGDDLLGQGFGAYLGAEEAVARWATRGGCDTTSSVTGDPLDLDVGLAGDETLVTRYEAGCDVTAELWHIVGGGHLPALQRTFTPGVLDWLRAHAR